MNKYAFITGATAGFGDACAQFFVKNGWNLVITGRKKERLEKLEEEIKSTYGIHVLSLN